MRGRDEECFKLRGREINAALEQMVEEATEHRSSGTLRVVIVANRPVLKEERGHGAYSIYASARRRSCGERGGTLFERVVNFGMFFDITQHGDARRNGKRIARKRAGLIDRSGRSDLAHHIGAPAISGDWQTGADDFAERGEIGLNFK